MQQGESGHGHGRSSEFQPVGTKGVEISLATLRQVGIVWYQPCAGFFPCSSHTMFVRYDHDACVMRITADTRDRNLRTEYSTSPSNATTIFSCNDRGDWLALLRLKPWYSCDQILLSSCEEFRIGRSHLRVCRGVLTEDPTSRVYTLK